MPPAGDATSVGNGAVKNLFWRFFNWLRYRRLRKTNANPHMRR
jgi:hypothetical protein